MNTDSICRILITGDFFLENKNVVIDSYAEEALFNDFLPIIKSADLAIVNFEGPVDKGASAISKTGPVLKSPPESIEILKKSGFHLLSLATNHIMDLGINGLTDTILTCQEKQMDYVGIGKNLEEARLPQYYNIKQYRIAILNFAENEFSTTHGDTPGANPLDLINNFQDIKQAKEKSDFVVVIIHGGHENYVLPSPRMKSTYRFFVEAGADAIIGHHTHCFSGYEIYNGVPIVYSLGNLVFEWHGKKIDTWYIGYAVQLFFQDNGLQFSIIPYTQFKNQLGLRLLTKSEKNEFHYKIEELNTIIQDDSSLSKMFDQFCKKNSKTYFRYIEPHSFRFLHALHNRGLFPSLLPKLKKKYLLNLIRCESHRDILIKLLESENSHS